MGRCRITSVEEGCGVDYRGVPFVGCRGLTDVKMSCEGGGFAEAAVSLEFCLIDSFYARPRRAGVGSSAVPVLLRWMRSKGCEEASLYPAREGGGGVEEDTMAFWERMGFRFENRPGFEEDEVMFRSTSP